MTLPFREEEAAALARAESLEIENQELRGEIEKIKADAREKRAASREAIEARAAKEENEELRKEVERLKDRIGLNRDAYVKNVEDQLRALKVELADIKARREAPSVWWPPKPTSSGTDTGIILGVVGAIALAISLATLFFR